MGEQAEQARTAEQTAEARTAAEQKAAEKRIAALEVELRTAEQAAEQARTAEQAAEARTAAAQHAAEARIAALQVELRIAEQAAEARKAEAEARTAQHARKLRKEAESNELLCVACLSARKTVVLQPCRHLVFCISCFHESQKSSHQCPKCRATVNGHLDIYM